MKLAMGLSIVFIAYIIGYMVGRKDVVDDIKEMTRQLKESSNDNMS